jgi:class 3 adenylate cyclase
VEQQIKYTITPDGARIAYSTMGSGPPLLFIVGFPFSHLKEELKIDSARSLYEALARHCTLIRLNLRGSGMSQRTGVEFTPELMVSDVVAVLDALNLEATDVIGSYAGGGTALELAAMHPERVRNLVLIDTSPYNFPESGDSQSRAILSIVEKDWQTFLKATAAAVNGWDSAADSAAMVGVLQACVDPKTFIKAYEVFARDVTHDRQLNLLRSVRARTLVVQHEKAFSPPVEIAQEMAAELSDGSLILLDGAWMKDAEDAQELAALALEFIGVIDGRRRVEAPRDTSGAIATILFTDMVGHTEMMARLGDSGGRDVLREHEKTTRSKLAEHGGAEVKSMGDGFMASFSSVTAAIDCAVDLQRAFADNSDIAIRVGLNAGEPIAEEGDLFGATVILASRVCDEAAAGVILIPEPVRHLLAGKTYSYADRGEFVPKGFDDAVRLFEVKWE